MKPPRSPRDIRLTLAREPADVIDGGWWPHTPSISNELPQLVDALRTSLGQILDISLNWSSIRGVPDLDMRIRRGVPALPGWQAQRQRIMDVTGSQRRVRLLVVPSKTSAALAVMVLRHAASLPIEPSHVDTNACRVAHDIVCAARSECGRPAEPVSG
jgi:hypothetical protein